MRKISILAAAISASFAVPALAQSSVTTYGALDMYLGYAKSSDGSYKQTRLNEGLLMASQLGFRGTEDLGGGMSAVFVIEAGINTDTGLGNAAGSVPYGTNTGLAFTRQSYVGLSSTSLGTLTFGRQYSPIFGTILRPDPYNVVATLSPALLHYQTGSQPGLIAVQTRVDNSVMYASPTKFPIRGYLMVGFGESSRDSTSSGNYLSGALQYASGPIDIRYAFQDVKSGSGAAPVASPTTSKIQALSGAYEVAAFRVGASYARQGLDVGGAPKATIMAVYGKYNMGAHSLLFAYSNRNVASSPNDQSAFALGYDYNLSKRTAFYARYGMLSNKGTSSGSLYGVVLPANSGADASLTGVGLVHRF